MPPKLTTRAFIEKARTVHGERYDYSRVEYSGSEGGVIIICSEHGSFTQKASSHLYGSNCPKCSGFQKASEQFICRARTIHGERYDYSLADYSAAHTPTVIICPEHGEFSQTPNNHLRGKGCNKCGYLVGSTKQRSELEHFLSRARAIHGERYDYSRVEYQGSSRNVTIICPVHGEFSQLPLNHYRTGCNKCGASLTAASLGSDKQEFISKAFILHGERYDYSKVEYKKSRIKVIIICPEHDEFMQTPNSHLMGAGCPHCNQSVFWTRSQWTAIQKGRKATLYIILLEKDSESFYKVGITYKSISERFGYRMPYQIKIVALFKSYDAKKIFDLESECHKKLRSYHYLPSHSFGGKTECFSSILPLLNILLPETFFLKNRLLK
jgi:hypothetical protein